MAARSFIAASVDDMTPLLTRTLLGYGALCSLPFIAGRTAADRKRGR